MPREHAIVALDVGTTKICTLVAEVEPERTLNIVGVGTAPSHGMRKGVVVNIDEVAASIAEAVDKCERLSGYRVESAHVGVTGAHIAGMNTRGVVALSSSAHEIGPADVDRAMEAARVQAISHDREVLHVIPRGYTLDGQEGVRDPVGMSGHRLEAEIHIVTAATTSVHNLVRAVKRAGIHIDELVLQPLASSEAVLTSAERELGVALADIGGGTTDVAIFVDNGVCHTAALNVGGNHITNDLALGLRAPFSIAEDVKIKYGAAIAAEVDPTEVVEVPTFDQEEGERISKQLIASIIESRVQEIFALIGAEIERAGYAGLLPAGLVLTGGTAELRDIRRLGRNVLGLPVRVGHPGGVVGLTDTITHPAFATSIGLLLWAAGRHLESAATVSAPSTPQWRIGSGWLGRWLREFLP
jgi:cell division protein FtsA